MRHTVVLRDAALTWLARVCLMLVAECLRTLCRFEVSAGRMITRKHGWRRGWWVGRSIYTNRCVELVRSGWRLREGAALLPDVERAVGEYEPVDVAEALNIVARPLADAALAQRNRGWTVAERLGIVQCSEGNALGNYARALRRGRRKRRRGWKRRRRRLR